MIAANIISEITTPLGVVTIFYLGGVLGFLSYGVALPKIEEITIKGLVLGSLLWPVILVYDISSMVTNSVYSDSG